MNTSFNDAISAYRAAARSATGVAKPGGDSLETAETKPGESFADLVKGTVKTTVDANYKAERLSMAAIAGKADLRDVVAAVTNAELTLETVVAVRDRVIGAYNDILKMPM